MQFNSKPGPAQAVGAASVIPFVRIDAGERVVVAGVNELSDGQTIKIDQEFDQ